MGRIIYTGAITRLFFRFLVASKLNGEIIMDGSLLPPSLPSQRSGRLFRLSLTDHLQKWSKLSLSGAFFMIIGGSLIQNDIDYMTSHHYWGCQNDGNFCSGYYYGRNLAIFGILFISTGFLLEMIHACKSSLPTDSNQKAAHITRKISSFVTFLVGILVMAGAFGRFSVEVFSGTSRYFVFTPFFSIYLISCAIQLYTEGKKAYFGKPTPQIDTAEPRDESHLQA